MKSKNYKKAQESLGEKKSYSLDEAIELLGKFPKAKFDESVELAIKTNVDPRKSDQQIRGTVTLPYGTGKTKKIAAFTETQAKEAKEAGADLVGGEELVEKVIKGKIDFEIAVATTEMMPKLAKAAKILGPKGLMPNPKTETVGPKIVPMIEALKKGRASFKTDDSGNVHGTIGKQSFSAEQIKENAENFIKAINENKPAPVKGKLIRSITLSATMTPGIKISL